MNRTRASSLDAFGLRDQRNRIFPALEASDGSTLSLDFTRMSSLDPRFTFSRSSNATFINSSGRVQYADANMITGSELLQPGLYQWNAQNGATQEFDPTVVNPSGSFGASQLIASAENGSSAINSSPVSVIGGFTYTLTFYVRAGNSSSILVGLYETAAFAPATGTILSGPGSISGTGAIAVTGLTSAWTRVRIYITPTITASGKLISFYPDNAQASGLFVLVWGAQFNIGQTANPGYFKTVSTAYQGPRFDYDPTTLTPRGLLIEGAATNLATRSDDFNTSVSDGSQWVTNTYTSGTLSTTLPDGTTGNARLISLASGSGSFRSQGLTVAANTAYTWSFWARNNGGSQARYRVWNVTAGSSIVDYTLSGSNYVSLIGGANNTSSTWVRVSVSFTTPVGCTSVYVYPCSSDDGTVDLLVWGAQLEAGSGASSYISTGASQGTRAEDGVVLSNLLGIAFNQSAGTIYSQLEIVEKLRGSFVPYGSFDTSGGGRCWWWFRHNHDTGVGQRILGNAFNSGGTTAITSSNYTHSSGVFKFATSLDSVAGRMVYAIAGGSAQVTSASGFTLATAAQMSLNKNSDVTATNLGSMWIRTIKYWPTALPDATLQSITT